MLTRDQVDYFDTFGFILLRQAFSPEEMEQITGAGNELWDAELQRDPGATTVNIAPFVELSPSLDWLATDDRLYAVMEQLLGTGFVWAGSEGNNGVKPEPTHEWHADRPTAPEANYLRIKIMLYLAPMKKEEGALRVIPSSHRGPLHDQLQPFQNVHTQQNPTYFGMHGSDVPCYALETQPGDAAVFSQSIFHGVYGKLPDRRYIALKYAVRPTADAHLASLHHYSPYAFEAHGSFADSTSRRVRGMVDPMVQSRDRAAGLVPEYYP